jgi:hypothetical protein
MPIRGDGRRDQARTVGPVGGFDRTDNRGRRGEREEFSHRGSTVWLSRPSPAAGGRRGLETRCETRGVIRDGCPPLSPRTPDIRFSPSSPGASRSQRRFQRQDGVSQFAAGRTRIPEALPSAPKEPRVLDGNPRFTAITALQCCVLSRIPTRFRIHRTRCLIKDALPLPSRGS